MLNSRYGHPAGRQAVSLPGKCPVSNLQLLYYGLGWFCLGAGLSVGLIFILTGRRSETQDGQGCLGALIALIGILAAVLFLFLAFQ